MTSLPPPRSYQMLIAGEWVSSVGGATFSRESPAHGTAVGHYPEATAADVDLAVDAAYAAFRGGEWSRRPGSERAAALQRIAHGIRERAAELALVECLESGKPITQARDEMEWAAGNWDYAASLARQVYGQSHNALGEDMLAVVLREPIGVVAMITPWNFPLLIISQKLPLALAAGCTAVVKPSELTPGTTLLLGEIIEAAGVPPGTVNIVTGYGEPVGVRLVEHPHVAMVSFTGSTAVGRRIAATAGQGLKKVSLELGGKNAQVVFADADLEEVADAVVFGMLFNAGECCNSGSRLIVDATVAESLLERISTLAQNVKVGDPLDEATRVGAIIHEGHFEKIQTFIDDAREDGAELALGKAEGNTFPYVAPTILDAVRPEMDVARSEVFGPVLSVLRFTSEAQALELANGTEYGLSASVWTKDIDRALRLSRRLEAGTVWVNTFMNGYAELPFGGYKQSGLGREMGTYALDEFTELKTVQVHLGPRTSWWARS